MHPVILYSAPFIYPFSKNCPLPHFRFCTFLIPPSVISTAGQNIHNFVIVTSRLEISHMILVFVQTIDLFFLYILLV